MSHVSAEQGRSSELPVFSTTVDAATTRARIDGYHAWYHTFRFQPPASEEIGPAKSQQRSEVIWNALSRLGLPEQASGLRILDIGCCDGLYSFAMEQRGANVTSIDYRDVATRGFGIARSIIGSSLEPSVDTVYNLNPNRYGRFDIVLFLGVLYHLRHPLLALDRIRSVMNPGGSLFIESHVLLDPPSPSLTRYYRRGELQGQASNHFGPNIPCIEAWLDSAEFEMIAHEGPIGSRICALGRAVENQSTAFWRDSEWDPGLRPSDGAEPSAPGT